MEIRNGIKFNIGVTSHYIIKNADGKSGEVWAFSSSDNDYCNYCSKYTEEEFYDHKQLKLMEYPYKVDDYVIALRADSNIIVGNIYRITEGIKSWSAKGDDGCSKVFYINKCPHYTSYFRPAFSWEIPKEKVKSDTVSLIEGGIYYWESHGGKYLDKLSSHENGYFKSCSNINLNNNTFSKSSENLSISSMKNLRIVTSEEMQWFNACEKAGKFIDKETVLNKKEEIMNDLDKMIAEKENYINITSSGPLKSTSDNKLSPASEMKTTISGIKPRSKKVCYTSTVIKIAM